MRYTSSHVESFGRFAEPFDLPIARQGLVHVEATNLDSHGAFDSNASSKSFLLEAIFAWNPFNKLPRYGDARLGADEICIDGRIADITNEIETSRGRFRVQRYRRGSATRLDVTSFRDGEFKPLEGVSADALLADDGLSTLLGFDYVTLRSALFLQGSSLDTAGATFSKQLAVLESVLRFDEFTGGAKLAKQRVDESERSVRQLVDEIERKSVAVENATHTLRDLQALDESATEATLVAEIAECDAQLAMRPQWERAKKLASKRLDLLTAVECAAERDVDVLLDQLASLDDIVGAHTCPTCEQTLTKKYAADLIKRVRTSLTVARARYGAAKSSTDAYRGTYTGAERELDALKEAEYRRTRWQQELDDLRARADKRLVLVQTQEHRRVEAETEVARLTEAAANARRETQIGKYGKAALDGLKPETFMRAAPVYDHWAAHYSDLFTDNTIRLRLNPQRESRDDRIITIEGACAPTYAGCSSGERRRISLINAFALRELAKWRVGDTVNAVVYDEIFDALDESGIRRMITVLERDLQEIETAYVVTHLDRLKTLLPSHRTLRVLRERGLARVEFLDAAPIHRARPRRTAI